MFRLLGKINIATQLTIMVAVVAGLAIFVVSRAAEHRSQDLLLERAYGSLADECLLRGFAIREAIRTYMREARESSDRVDRALRGGPAGRDLALEQVFTGTGEAGDEVDRSAIHEVCLVQISSTGKINNRAVFRGTHDRPRAVSLPGDEPSNPTTATLWDRLLRGLRDGGTASFASTRQFVSDLRRVRPQGGKDGPWAYHLAIAASLQNTPTGDRMFLLVTIDFSRLVDNQARRLPRHLVFVQAEDGRWAYHPDPAAIGTEQDTWELFERSGTRPGGKAPERGALARTPGEPQRGVLLPARYLPDLGYYTIRKRLPPQLTDCKESCIDLEEDLALPGLRFSRVWEGAPSVVLSARDPEGLEKAHQRIARREKDALGQPGPWPTPILCENFVGHHIPQVFLDTNKETPIGIILAGSQEEMTADVHSAAIQMWYRWFLPVLLGAAALGLVSAHILTRPLRRLTEAAQRMTHGDYNVDVRVTAPGEVGELAGTFRDMTSQIRARERELRENLARFNTILANAADGIITFDQTGKIEQANEAAEEMFGVKRGGLSGTRVQSLMKLPEHLQKPVVNFTLAGGAGSGGSSSMAGHGGTVTQLFNAVKTPGEEHRGLRRDGTTFWMEVTFSQVPLEDRRLITGIFRDVTQRKLAEERIRLMNDELDARVRLRTAQLEDAKIKLELALAQAESASAAKDRFISVVSHELRTPLTSAMGYTELLLNPRATRLRENPIPTLEKILTSCKHLLTLINDLLDVGRYTAGKPIALEPTRFDLNVFLRGVQEMVAPLVKKNGNALELHVSADLGEVTNDETRLRQILLNLLSNASKFTEKGKVGLRVERLTAAEGDHILIQVSDTGAGMTPEQLEKLFTPFYRVDNSMTRRQGGTGLGLTITKMLCELMGGKIEPHSQPGQGSTFSVLLPAVISTQLRKGETQTEKPSGPESRGTVLVIDDDQTIRQMLETYLQQEGYKVVLAGSGAEGLRLARANKPDMITLDVLMPGEDGWDVLGRLKNDSLTRDIPVIMLTIMEERNRGFALGATEYVTKPIDWGRLGSILCRFNPGQAPILVVEDDALQRSFLREELILAGWTVQEAANGVEALKACDESPPSLILLDLTMPIMDGFTFLEELRRRPGGMDIPVVVVTARDLSDEDRRRLNRSVAQVLAKESLSAEKLLDRIREQMRSATGKAE